MNATEYFKKMGWNFSNIHLAELEHNKCFDDFYYDLKRIIESHELVSNFGGLKRAKRILKKSYTQFNTMVSVVWNDRPFQCTVQQLEQSVSHVESCL